jgi:hypothetical protein
MQSAQHVSGSEEVLHPTMIASLIEQLGLGFDEKNGVLVLDRFRVVAALGTTHSRAIAAIGLSLQTSKSIEAEQLLNGVQLSEIALCRLEMESAEAWALALACGAVPCVSEPIDDSHFHAELRRTIQKFQLWKFFNASGPGLEHRSIVPSAYDAFVGEVRPGEMAEWRASFRALSPGRQMMLATIVWLYRGSKDSIWLRRVPIAWNVLDAVRALRDEGMLADWGLLIARYPGW